LGNNDFKVVGALQLAEYFTTHKSIKYLDVGNNGIGKEGLAKLLQSLTPEGGKKAEPNLVHLDI
jgi:Ran GTPase-activating protein (RanGAP) involved in mRNA processing and transport